MKKRPWFLTPAATGLAFAAAIGLLAFSGIGIARAVPAIRTDNEYTNIAHESIGVALLENGVTPPGGTLLGTILNQTNNKLVLNHAYNEPLSVRNTGEINEYVRVTVRKYWVGADGKETDLSPELIHVSLGDADIYDPAFRGANGWVKDANVSTSERVVFYYSQVVPGNGSSAGTTGTFADSVRIDNGIATEVASEPEADGKTIINKYKYNGVQFCLEATVDAVQEHNAEYTDADGNVVGAIRSAWGVEASSVGINVG